MALVIYQDDRREVLLHDDGVHLWQLLTGDVEPSADEEKIIVTVKHLYLNWRDAPDSYVKRYLPAIIPMALVEWTCDVHGNIRRPGTNFAWSFAKKWGLWKKGIPGDIVWPFISDGSVHPLGGKLKK